MYCKRLLEFKYSLLNNILSSNSHLQKCILRQNSKCDTFDISNEDV